jgi:CP family cyanate transporter-like MFS transporter
VKSGREAALLWLGGFALRAPLLAVPPLLPLIVRALGLSHTAVGLLTGFPVILFAVAAVGGSLLIARLGVRRAIALSLAVTSIGGAARGIGGGAVMLFAMTIVMGAGIALAQPAMIAVAAGSVRTGAARAMSIYSNGLVVGEVVAVAATLPLAGWLGGWGLGLAAWSLPVAAAAFAFLRQREVAPAARGAWLPDYRDPTTWRIGLMLGCTSAIYQVSNAFIPTYLTATGRTALVAPALTSLNLIQVAGSLLMAAFPALIERAGAMVAAAAVTLAATVALVAIPAPAAVLASAGLLGCAASTIFIQGLALPALLVPREEVPRVSAGMFTISYTCGFLGLVLGGQLGDRLAAPDASLVPVALACVAAMVLAAGIRRPQAEARRDVAAAHHA